MASIRGRLTRHFLGRIVMLLVALSAVFLMWLGALAYWTLKAQPNEVPPTTLLRDLSRATSIEGTSTVRIAPTLVAAVREKGMWLQVLDERGSEIWQSGRPPKVPTRYTPGRLVLFRQDPDRIGQGSIYTWAEVVDGQDVTYVLGRQDARKFLPFGDITQEQRWGLTVLLLAAGGAVVLGVSVVSGASMARPLAHMMEWLRALASGDHAEPIDRDGRATSRDRLGERKSPYTTYREVFDALDGLTGELRRAEDERARLESAREEWMAGVSHDLRTPLSSVRGYAEVLASDYDFESSEVRRQAAIIRDQASHMDALLDDLNLTFRLRADALPLTRERIDLVELARETAVALANDPRATGREVEFEPPAEAVFASLDRHWFRRALGNLLVNAAHHNPPGTTVRLGVEREGRDAVVTVRDNGRGMDAETLSALFDRYYRGTATDAASEGSGLGMAIARQLVEAHGGRIEVESEPGAGTTVRVLVEFSSC